MVVEKKIDELGAKDMKDMGRLREVYERIRCKQWKYCQKYSSRASTNMS